jgi:metal-responsive CopG/Arc/MetJ family transcriptional regulator
MSQKREYERFSVSIPAEINDVFEELRNKLNISRSDAIRKAMRLFVNQETDQLQEQDTRSVLGTITYMEKAHVHGHPQDMSSEIQFTIDPTNEESKSSDHNHHEHDTDIDMKQGQHRHGDIVHTHEHAEGYYTSMEKQEYVQTTEMEHNFLDVIISTTHIHAGPEKCMLVLAVRGNMKRIQELVKKLSQFKIVENIQFVIVERY